MRLDAAWSSPGTLSSSMMSLILCIVCMSVYMRSGHEINLHPALQGPEQQWICMCGDMYSNEKMLKDLRFSTLASNSMNECHSFINKKIKKLKRKANLKETKRCYRYAATISGNSNHSWVLQATFPIQDKNRPPANDAKEGGLAKRTGQESGCTLIEEAELGGCELQT